MAITIRDCLQLNSLSHCRVIAGQGGLDNVVSSVSVIEFMDFSPSDQIKPNQLVISSLYSFRNDVEGQCRVIQHSKKFGDVGLILFYSDEVLHGINPMVLEVANQLDYPIIAVPPTDDISFSDVISEVMEAILLDRMNLKDEKREVATSPIRSVEDAVVVIIEKGSYVNIGPYWSSQLRDFDTIALVRGKDRAAVSERMSEAKVDYKIVDYRGTLILLMRTREMEYFKDLLDAIIDETKGEFKGVFFQNVDATSQLISLYGKFVTNLDAMEIAYPNRCIFNSFELDFISECKVLSMGKTSWSCGVPEILEPLASDMKDYRVILETLMVYMLDANSQVIGTSKLMFLHRNTVLYRLKRASRILGFDIDKAPFRMQLYMALVVLRISEGS